MNQRDEQRVIEALQAFTGGLTVTENDMLIAGRNLKDNLEPPRPRRRLAMVAVAAAALVAGFVVFQVINASDDADTVKPAQTQTPAEALTAALEPDAYNLPVDESGASDSPDCRAAGRLLAVAPVRRRDSSHARGR